MRQHRKRHDRKRHRKCRNCNEDCCHRRAPTQELVRTPAISAAMSAKSWWAVVEMA
jgi:hypothetical protein